MKVLVTGGTGFVGRELVKELVSEGYDVRCTSRQPDNLSAIAELMIGDIRDLAFLNHCCKGCEAVFHLASKVGVWGKYSDFYSTNVDATKLLIDVCNGNNVSYFIYASSASVVFGGEDIENGNESISYPTHQLSNYTKTKALAEKYIIQSNGNNIKTISLRPHLIWGPTDKHIIPGILKSAQEGKLVQVGNYNKLVDTTYIDNFIDALKLSLLGLMNNPMVAGNCYFITNGEPIKIWDFINKILEVYEYASIAKSVPRSLALGIVGLQEMFYKCFLPNQNIQSTRMVIKELCQAHWFDISKAVNDLGYNPKISIDDGFERLKKFKTKLIS